jgi:superfamily II RNA helicase
LYGRNGYNAVLFSTAVFFYLQGVRQIEEMAKNVKCMERKCGIESGHDKLNFGLVEVVYEWAQGKVSLYIKF